MPLDIEFKGGVTRLRANFIVITSPYDPVDCFKYRDVQGGADRVDDNVAQLVRRIRFVYKIASVGGAFAAFDETARVRQSCGLPASSGDGAGKEYFDSITAVPIGGGVHSDLRGDLLCPLRGSFLLSVRLSLSLPLSGQALRASALIHFTVAFGLVLNVMLGPLLST